MCEKDVDFCKQVGNYVQERYHPNNPYVEMCGDAILSMEPMIESILKRNCISSFFKLMRNKHQAFEKCCEIILEETKDKDSVFSIVIMYLFLHFCSDGKEDETLRNSCEKSSKY